MGIPKALQIVTNYVPHNYAFSRVIDRFMASGDVFPTKLTGPPRTKIIEENIDRVGNLVEEKPDFSFSEVSTAMNLSTGILCVWKILRKTLRKYLCNLKLSKVLLINTNYVEYIFAIGRAFEYKLKSFKKRLDR